MRSAVERAGATYESGDGAAKRVTLSIDGATANSATVTRADVEAALEAIGFPPESG